MPRVKKMSATVNTAPQFPKIQDILIGLREEIENSLEIDNQAKTLIAQQEKLKERFSALKMRHRETKNTLRQKPTKTNQNKLLKIEEQVAILEEKMAANSSELAAVKDEAHALKTFLAKVQGAVKLVARFEKEWDKKHPKKATKKVKPAKPATSSQATPTAETAATPTLKRRGRPPKAASTEANADLKKTSGTNRRGRPAKTAAPTQPIAAESLKASVTPAPKKRGRPSKAQKNPEMAGNTMNEESIMNFFAQLEENTAKMPQPESV